MENIITAERAGWWSRVVAPTTRRLWAAYGELILRIAIVLVAAGTIFRLSHVIPDMLWGYYNPGAACDLLFRYLEVQTWFAGKQVYGAIETADYPPASYAIFWPFLGWASLAMARWLWAGAIMTGLITLAAIITRAVKADTKTRWLFLALLPFSVYPTASVIWLGQFTIHCLASLAVGLLILLRGRGRWWEDILAATVLLVSLAKPTVVAPFFWLVLILPGRLRPITLVSVGYLSLTLLAASFQDANLLTLIKGWRGQETQMEFSEGHTNLTKLLISVGLKQALAPVALLGLLGIGALTWRFRKVNFWLLIGILGLVSRLWIHHRTQDDLLILAPMIALLRLAMRSKAPDGSDVKAGLLFAFNWLTMLAPVSLIMGYPGLLLSMELLLGALWMLTLLFLLSQANRERAGKSGLEFREYAVLQGQ